MSNTQSKLKQWKLYPLIIWFLLAIILLILIIYPAIIHNADPGKVMSPPTSRGL